MTKCIVLGEDNTEKKKNPIKFINYMDGFGKIFNMAPQPCEWMNIELVSLDYRGSRQDLIFAYNENRSDGELYFGRWNDGIV